MSVATTARNLIDRHTSEDELLAMVVELAQRRRWLVHHVRRSDKALQMGDNGFPDLVLVGHGQTLYRELKNETRKLDPAQVRWRDRLLEAGADWALWRPSSWIEIEDTLCTKEARSTSR